MVPNLPRPPEGDFSDVQNLVGGGEKGRRAGSGEGMWPGWTAGGRMSNESETSGERRKRIARPPLRTRRKGKGRADGKEQRAVYTIKGS